MQRPKRPGRYHLHEDGCKCNFSTFIGNGEETTRPGTPTPDLRQHQHHGPWARERFDNRHDPRDIRKPLFKFHVRHMRDYAQRRRLPPATYPTISMGDGRRPTMETLVANLDREPWLQRDFLPLSNLAPLFNEQFLFKPEQVHPPRPGPPPPPPVHVQSDSLPCNSKSDRCISSVSCSADTKNDVMSRLLSVLECPVCFEYVSPPILQCQEGHLVCSGCRSRLDLCPKCRQPFSDIRARALEQVAEVINYPCHNVGCSAQLPMTERQAHEAICPHRQYSCTIEPCNWVGIRSALPEHMEEHHPQSFIKSSTHDLNLTVTQNVANEEKTFLMQCHDEIFHCVMAVDCQQDIFVGFVMHIGPHENAANFEFELKFEHNGPPYTSVSIIRTALEESANGTLAGINGGVNAVVVSFSTLREVIKETSQGTSVLPVHINVRMRQPPPPPPPQPFVSVSIVTDHNLPSTSDII